MNAMALLSSPKFLSALVLAGLSAAVIASVKSERGWVRWGQNLSAFLVFCVTLVNVLQYSPTEPNALVDAGAKWLVQALGVAFLGFSIGAVSYALMCGGLAGVREARRLTAKGTEYAKTYGVKSDSKSCPFCAEEIKAQAIYCRFCHRDIPTQVDQEPLVGMRSASAGMSTLEAGIQVRETNKNVSESSDGEKKHSFTPREAKWLLWFWGAFGALLLFGSVFSRDWAGLAMAVVIIAAAYQFRKQIR